MRSYTRPLATAVAIVCLLASCTPAPPPHKGPRTVLIVGDSIIFQDQFRLYRQIEADKKWKIVAIDSTLGATTYRHPTLPAALANTKVDAVVLSFGYNEISDVRGDIYKPIPFSAVKQSWADVLKVN